MNASMPGPDSISAEALLAAKPNTAAQQAIADERARILVMAEHRIVEQLLTHGVSDAIHLSRVTVDARLHSERQSTHATSLLWAVWEQTHHPKIQEEIEDTISLASAVGAVAEATTVTGLDATSAGDFFDVAVEAIADPRLTGDARQVLGSFLVNGATGSTFLPEN